ncbi:uncharacterized protein LOC141618995 [Silene latifolia]|uniref:uncharacterized protein LOC141618995 n=1 Tax=Silene latifolia TaxID=37657 RepID=UPI003D77C3F9
MVILENKYEIGATNFPENDTIKHLHSSTSILYRTYGGCNEDTSTSYWFTDSKEEEAVIAFAKAVEDAYNKKRAVTSTRPINQHQWQDDDNSHGDVIPPSFSLGLSQDELFNNPKVALLSPTTNVDHDTVVRDILLEISTDQKDEHGDKKADQEGDDLVQKDDDKSCAEVHEDANTQSDSEKTISDGDCEPDSNSRLSPTRYHVVTRRRGSSAALVPELRSPFIVRDVDTVSSLTKVQRLVCDYIYADFGQESSLHNEKVFMYKGITAIRLQFQSLKPRELVSSAILDCWSAYLNHREISKSDLSPLRFYISTFVLIVFTDYRKNKSDESRYKFFRNAMNDELKQFSRISLKSIDMFFFPVALNAHYYLMVFDLKTPAFYLIDNWLTRAKVENCYGDTPMLVAAAFGRFLKETRDTYSKGVVVCTLTPVRINMPWRTK